MGKPLNKNRIVQATPKRQAHALELASPQNRKNLIMLSHKHHEKVLTLSASKIPTVQLKRPLKEKARAKVNVERKGDEDIFIAKQK